MNALKLIVFTLIIPGFAVGYVPYTIYSSQQIFEISIFRYVGLILIPLGVLIYMWSAINFLRQGKGTPAIWFTKGLKFLIGQEPTKLVSAGLYKISRNPMYLGVIFIVLGQSILFESKTILAYTLILSTIFHFVIIFLEEPHLKKKYGKEYESYLKNTSRWLGPRKKIKMPHHRSKTALNKF